MALPENASTFCASCGLPMRTSRCDACGGNAQPLPLEDGDPLAALDARGDASPLAREAWSRRDWASFVSHALGVEHVHDARSARLTDGPGFVAVVGGVAVLVSVRQTAQQIVIEAPVARLPATMTVPALRVLLEASDAPAPGARFSVRDDLVVARFVGRLDQDEPLLFGAALRGVVAAAREMAELLVATTDARMLAPSEHQALDFDTLPPARFLGRVAHAAAAPAPPPPAAASASRRQQAAPFRSSSAATAPAIPAVSPSPPPAAPPPSPIAARPRSAPRATVSGAFDALLAAAPAPAHLPPPRAPDPFSQPSPAFDFEGSGASPHTEASPGAPRASTPPPGPALEPPPRPAGSIAKTVEVAQAPGLRPPPRATNRPTPLAVAAVSAPPIGRTVPDDGPAVRVATNARGVDLASTQVSEAPPPPGPKALCELLHRAQTLGAVLSFADKPATMLLLVRATVYRAVFELLDSAPGAVSTLFQETLPLIREIHITAPGIRRGAMALPEAEGAFAVFERIVAAGGVLPASSPPAIEPITTAQDAKQHLARYVSEIDQAPSDLELRHYLGLGALCELVVRTKLPPQTLDRVRGIIARSIKEGARQSSIDLMMTALNRIIGG